MAVLAVPKTCADINITMYHSSSFAGHQGVIKTYLTISEKFFIPNLIHYLRSYIKGCYICQLMHNEKLPVRQLQTRINPYYIPLSRLSMDLKVMPDHIGAINSTYLSFMKQPIIQLMHNEKLPVRQLQTRINPYYIPLSRLSMDLKVMPDHIRAINSTYLSFMKQPII